MSTRLPILNGLAPPTDPSMDLLSKLRDRSATVAVVGLGYAGLPLALSFADAGFRVLGIDVDPERVRRLNAGQSHVEDVRPERLQAHIAAGRFRASADYADLAEADTATISVPTPLGPGHLPDLSFVERAVDGIAPVLRRGRGREQLIVLESTTYPGTTDELVRPRLERGGLRAGEDFYLGFAPERIDPGGTTSGGLTFRQVPKLVAGATPRCLEVATALYAAIVDRVVPVSSLKTAEMAKLVENAFRMVNVGFANEVALWCDQLGLDVWEVIDAAATKPFGFMPHYPGPGLGGHCIPVDPYYLVWKLKTLDYPARFIELAGEINRAMPPFVVSKVQGALERHGRPLRGSRVLVLGAAYKRDVADVRESPSLDVIGLLVEHGALVEYHDPHVPSVTVRLSERALA
ncbi:MAG TPA: nucleotide sugar dehydrogenase, partial [Chloroflexota bacterium]|nr:nucleotide sugar dehydrogenase [Chloroflexota bacterium]